MGPLVVAVDGTKQVYSFVEEVYLQAEAVVQCILCMRRGLRFVCDQAVVVVVCKYGAGEEVCGSSKLSSDDGS